MMDKPTTSSGAGDEAAPALFGLPWARVVVLVAAFAFLASTVGWFVAQPRPPARGSVDAGSVLDMTAHHEQALQMANLELQDGENPNVRLFAQEILYQQGYELGRMDTILEDWDLSREDRPAEAMTWMDMSVPSEEMPGMATPGELAELRDATGRETDELFLELMAEHHRGAIHMASYAAANASDPQVRQLSERIARNQAVEINEFIHIADLEGLTVDIAPAAVPEAE